MPKPPGLPGETYYKLYDKGDVCMKFQRTFDPSKETQQYIFIGMAVYLSNEQGFNYGIQSYFF
jgi:hypothetical protein